MENPIKLDDLGVALFQETSIYSSTSDVRVLLRFTVELGPDVGWTRFLSQDILRPGKIQSAEDWAEMGRYISHHLE